MGWLQHNVVADLYGPYFLVFYAMLIAAVIVACFKSVRSVDRTGDLDPPQVRAKLDPYEIAYLRGGENEVTRVALASLVQRGLLKVTEQTKWSGKVIKIERARERHQDDLSPIESCVLNWPRFPAQATTIFQSGGLSTVVKKACAGFEAELLENNLLAPAEMKEVGARMWLFGSAIIVGMGGFKLWAALLNGHRNVLFLAIMAAVGVLFLALACLNRPRLSRLGKVYLENVKRAYSNLKDQLKPDGKLAHFANASGEPGTARVTAAQFDGLLVVGIFGLTALTDTPLADLNRMFAHGTSSGGGCGAGCGGGGGGCGGGGCGGCGG
jgi:uncharacterized protein (TIGR04222 family)